jgi:hypothetical protein
MLKDVSGGNNSEFRYLVMVSLVRGEGREFTHYAPINSTESQTQIERNKSKTKHASLVSRPVV